MQLRCTDRNGVRSGILRWNRYFFRRPENQDLLPSQRKVEGIVKSVLGCVKGVHRIELTPAPAADRRLGRSHRGAPAQVGLAGRRIDTRKHGSRSRRTSVPTADARRGAS